MVEDKGGGDGVEDTREWQLLKIEDKGDREGECYEVGVEHIES